MQTATQARAPLHRTERTCLRAAVGRVQPSDAVLTKVLPLLIAGFGWRNVGVLHVNDAYGNNFLKSLRDDSRGTNVTIVGSADFAINDPATYAPACVNMKALGTNVIMLVSFSDDIPQIMKVCKEKGFGGKGHVWIVADAAKASTAFEAGVASGQRPEETAALLNGMLQLIPQSK
eukprot:2520738-Prymnesium_polylepis.1